MRYHRRLSKLAILSLSLLPIMAGAAVAPALQEIAYAFPDAEETFIKLILSLPAMLIIPFTFVSGWLAKRLGKRRTLFLGLLGYLVGGLGGGISQSIWFLLATRVFLGIGVGLIMPLATSLIADFYEGKERERAMGQMGAATNLGGIVVLLLSGVLAAMSWRYAFGVYALGLPVVLLVILFLPEPEVRTQAVSGKERFPARVYGYAGLVMLLMLLFFSVPTNIALFLTATGIGGAKSAGVAIAGATVAGFVAGLLVSRVRSLTGPWFWVCFLGCIAGGFWLIASADSMVQVLVGMMGLGGGWGVMFPIILMEVSTIAPQSLRVLGMALMVSGLFLGQFLSPLVLDSIKGVLGAGSPESVFEICGVWMSGLAVCGLLVPLFKARKPVSQTDSPLS